MFKISLIVTLSLLGTTAQQWEANCGKSKYTDAGSHPNPDAGSHPMVVGGRDARVNELPWMVSLNNGLPTGYFCAGGIINANWIVTAAHCVAGREAEDTGATVGDHDTDPDLPSRVQVFISEIIVHPDYDAKAINNDIALMRTTQPMQLNENVRGICRATQSQEFYVGKNVTISGWGNTISGEPSAPDVLQVSEIQVFPRERCNTEHPNEITDAMFCAGEEDGYGRDTCQGDSGSPLVYNNNNRFELIGLASWGRGCADGTLGVNTKVLHFHSWIDGIVNS